MNSFSLHTIMPVIPITQSIAFITLLPEMKAIVSHFFSLQTITVVAMNTKNKAAAVDAQA